MTGKKKIIIFSTFAILAAIILVAGYLYWKAEKTVSYDTTIRAGSKSEVLVKRGVSGIPHIHAADEEDAFFALGYLHAQDRLVLIEYYRALASGTISALIGEEGLTIDKLSRTIGFLKEGEKLAGSIDARYSGYLQAYVNGINLFRESELDEMQNIAHLPRREWTSADVIAMLLMVEWSNSFINNREQVFQISNKLLTRDVKKALPPQLTFGYDEEDRSNVLLLKELNGLVKRYLGSFNKGYAFYIPSSATPDEQSFAAFSLENPNTVYSTWYPVRISIKGSDYIGITASGLPFLYSGKNKDISFSSVNLSLDVQDFFRELTRETAQGREYYKKGRWTEFKTREETIEISGASGEMTQVIHKVRYKDDIPVLSDVLKGRFTMDSITIKHAFPQKNYIHSLFDIPFSESVIAAGKTAAAMGGWPRAHLFASKNDTAVVYSGVIPRRDIGGSIFRRGETYSGSDFTINIAEYSRRYRTESPVIGSDMLDDLPGILSQYKVFNDSGRYRRLNNVIRVRSEQPQTLSEILHDTQSEIAKTFTPVFHGLLKDIPIPSAKLSRIFFKNWDHTVTRTSVPAAITHVLLYNMVNEILGDELRDEMYSVNKNLYWALEGFSELLLKDDSQLFDDTETLERVETRGEIFDRAFLKSLKYLNTNCGPFMGEWHWGKLHKILFDMPIGRERTLFGDELLKSNIYRTGGDDSTLMKGAVRVNNDFMSGEITGVSVCFRGKASSISRAMGVSLNPLSEFNTFFLDKRRFIDFESSNYRYEMRFIPAN